jgi:thiol-disulfide isomerase/thioredoxin
MFKTKIKAFFLILLVSVLLLLLVSFLTDKIQYNTAFSFTGYFFLTLISIKFFSKKLSAISVIWTIFATMLVLQSFTIYTWFIWDTFGLPVVAATCFAVISAFLLHKWKFPLNILPAFLSACFVVFMFFQGWDYWVHKMNYGTLTGRVQAFNLPAKFEGLNEQNEIVTDESFRNKIVLLDFWYTGCGVCFQKFPQVQAAYDRYKNDPSVAIFAVDKPIEEDTPGQAFQVIKDEGYSFPVVIAEDEELPKKFGVKFYPTTFVIDRGGQIVFRGDIEGAVKMVEELRGK